MPSHRIAFALTFLAAVATVPPSLARIHHIGPVTSAPTPTGWVGEVTNPYFPLPPGTTFHYEGETDGTPTSDDMAVTHQTKVILGVRCTVVRDRVYTDGILSEDTLDWYAQDNAGNVWYFGEDTAELDPAGNVTSTEGSWQAGVDGARQGIIMEAQPHVGDKYRQEFSLGVAEDTAQVLSVNKRACVRYGCFDDLLLTKELTALEKGVTEHKLYAPGTGMLSEELVKGGDERSELVSVSRRD